MAPKLPRKYVPAVGYAKIYYRKINKWAEWSAKNGVEPYFDTWDEAYQHLLSKAEKSVQRLERDLAAAKRHLARVLAMEKKNE